MNKLMKFSKVLLLIATIFSYVSSPIAVLADEITSKPLNILLAAIDEDNDGYIDNYELTCKSLNSEYDEDKTKENSVEIVLQIMGKVRSRITVPVDISKEDAIALAKADERIAAAIEGKTIKKEIYVPGKLVNIVAV